MNTPNADDTEFEDSVINAVEGDAAKGWSITKADGWSFFIDKDSPVEPTVGMTIRMYGRQHGAVRGVVLDGRCLYYRTEAEEKDYRNAETYGKDAADWLSRWDAGKSVWSVEMGGIGPGYEQAIQVTAAEMLRWMLDDKTDFGAMNGDDTAWEAWRKRRDAAMFALPAISDLGLSGAQYGAAGNLSSILYRRGPIAALSDDAVKDRKILVSRTFP